ncbi:MAG: glutamate racemase [Bacteroidota bacterium]|nr:glutamate racemase [Bacteroidota bacterium]MDP4234285.1 glutamate racemase [Bacteroidota bacterium]MDP4243220.1 glutamate racemase [Bacteroidota bacterium]MDP4288074.1 glutamate racemase [Bacteroidota bacterium]
MDVKPIGVFDSGIGGMTVVKELFTTVPHESIVYFGDTARVPYGAKSRDTVRRYAREDTELMLAHGVKMIVVACNTVSAVALDEVERMAGTIPVIGMIAPTAKEAVRATRTGRIGIIGTEATIASQAYEDAIAIEADRQSKPCETFSVACPLFVPLAEEGWTDHPATELVAEEYLRPLREQHIDTLVLGCTHYPVLLDIIQKTIGKNVTLVNSGAEAAKVVAAKLPNPSTLIPLPSSILVSDMPRKFQQIGERFLGRPMPEAKLVTWKESWVVS